MGCGCRGVGECGGGEGCASGRGGDRGGLDGREEHVVGLDGGADEEAGERDEWETEAAGEVLIREGLFEV